MNVTALFIALGGAILLSVLVIRRLRTKPWLEKGPIELEDGASGVPAEKVGLWIFLAVVTSLFSSFIVMYAERSGYPDWRPLPDLQLLWINTIFLVLGSVAFQRARVASDRDNFTGVKMSLTAGGIFTIIFLVGQVLAWQQLTASGYFLATNPASTFFYLITGLHGLHVLAGVVVMFYFAGPGSKLWKSDPDYFTNRIECTGLYWHFVDLVWIFVFPLLYLL